MGKIIAIINQKGGVGKTTTSINLSAGLAYTEHKTLLIDFDPQGNASNGLGCYLTAHSKTILDALKGEPLENCIHKTESKYLDLVPSNISLSNIELGKETIPDKTYALKRTIDKVKHKYDFIFIDCPPALSVLSQSVLTAADSVFIPIQSEYFALEGATQLLSSIREIQKTTNTNLTIEGVMLTMVDFRTTISKEIQEEVKRHFKDKMYVTRIPRNIDLSKATAMGQSIYVYNCNSEGAKAYVCMVNEFLKNQRPEMPKKIEISSVKADVSYATSKLDDVLKALGAS